MELVAMSAVPDSSKRLQENRKIISDVFGFTELLELPFEPGFEAVSLAAFPKKMAHVMLFDEESTEQERYCVREEYRRHGSLWDSRYPYFMESFVPTPERMLFGVNRATGKRTLLSVDLKVYLAYLFVGEPLEGFEQFEPFNAIEPKQYTSLGGRTFTARDVTDVVNELR
jgi:hypothetical protein